MNVHKYIGYAFLLTCIISCGTKTDIDTATKQTVESITAGDATTEKCH